jgi:signal transduction histidine kinase
LSADTENISFKDQIKKYFDLDDEENVYDTMAFYNLSFEMERPKTSQYSHLILECRSFPFRENFELSNLLILIHDITDQKKETRIKKDFLGSITHQITQQLTGIQKAIEIQQSQKKEELDLLVFEMNLRIQQLVTYTNTMDNASSLFASSVSFQQFINEISDQFKQVFVVKKINLTVKNEQQIDTIKIRKELVEIIFLELMLMSINRQTIKPQEIILSLTQKNNWLKVTFENFDFKRINSINNDNMTIIKHIASILKGKIEMDIQEETGSMFVLQIPFATQKN